MLLWLQIFLMESSFEDMPLIVNEWNDSMSGIHRGRRGVRVEVDKDVEETGLIMSY